MIELTRQALAAYLEEVHGPGTELLAAGDIGSLDEAGMKRFGYGKPLLVRFRAGGTVQEAVVSVMKGDKYGHQFYWDRAAILMFQHETSGRLPRHVKSLGLGYVDEASRLVPLGRPQEFFIVSEKLTGYDYFKDLERIRNSGEAGAGDLEQARAFARWLAEVHAQKKADPDLYFRRVRNLIGSSECIMGLVDEAYPQPYPQFPAGRFARLEKRVIDWRWKLKGYAHRLSAVHGDFHPWNVLVAGPGEPEAFRVLDRSRGEWGEPADDLATMAINYVLFGLDGKAALQPALRGLYQAFFEEYLARTGDDEVLEVIAPFFAFRGLVIASPEWYPGHAPEVRRGLLNLVENVLEDETFAWQDVESYMR